MYLYQQLTHRGCNTDEVFKEADALKGLKHPNIVAFVDAWIDDEDYPTSFHIVMGTFSEVFSLNLDKPFRLTQQLILLTR